MKNDSALEQHFTEKVVEKLHRKFQKAREVLTKDKKQKNKPWFQSTISGDTALYKIWFGFVKSESYTFLTFLANVPESGQKRNDDGETYEKRILFNNFLKIYGQNIFAYLQENQKYAKQFKLNICWKFEKPRYDNRQESPLSIQTPPEKIRLILESYRCIYLSIDTQDATSITNASILLYPIFCLFRDYTEQERLGRKDYGSFSLSKYQAIVDSCFGGANKAEEEFEFELDFDVPEETNIEQLSEEENEKTAFDKKVSSYLESPKSLPKNVKGNPTPKLIQKTVSTYERDPAVVAYALHRAKGVCEMCEKPAPFVKNADNQPFLEVHHVKHLSDNGQDTTDNVVAICPNCHRELHFGSISQQIWTRADILNYKKVENEISIAKIIHKMILAGSDDAFIAKITELSVSKIKSIRKNHKNNESILAVIASLSM